MHYLSLGVFYGKLCARGLLVQYEFLWEFLRITRTHIYYRANVQLLIGSLPVLIERNHSSILLGHVCATTAFLYKDRVVVIFFDNLHLFKHS